MSIYNNTEQISLLKILVASLSKNEHCKVNKKANRMEFKYM